MNLEKTDQREETAVGEVVREVAALRPVPAAKVRDSGPSMQLVYLILPMIFLSTTLFGGMRFAAIDGAVIFIKPSLICLVLAALTMVILFRSGAIAVSSWISSEKGTLANAANIGVLATIFTATTQIYNSLIPERGIAFWILGFCFLWTLWTNLFAELDARKTLKSVAAMFGLAFATKYLLLANMTAAPTGSWWRRLIDDPGKEAFTWLLDLPQYSDATGYLQFFVLAAFLLGLILTPPSPAVSLSEPKAH